MKYLYKKRFFPQAAALAVGTLAVVGAASIGFAPGCASPAPVETAAAGRPAALPVEAVMAHAPQSFGLDKPYDLPKDVFDLAYFNPFRHGGRLDVRAAKAALMTLSDSSLVAAQDLFDATAWRAFIALNWAAKSNGDADPSKGYADETTPKVWEFWKQSSDVFLPDGGHPAAWGGQSKRVVDSFKAGWRQTTSADQGKQAFSGPLVDQNGKWVHYTALLNQPEFDYIVSNELYNQEGQAVFSRSHQVSFPINDDTRHGAIEIKLAWKALTKAEIASGRFLVRRLPVVVYRPAGSLAPSAVPKAHLTGKSNGNAAPGTPLQAGAEEQTVGLVGMHISMRTRSSPQWIWATFEQIDNTRLDPHSGSPGHPLPAQPSLSNPNNPTALVAANILPPKNAVNAQGKPIDDWDESKRMAPVEVLRLVPPPPSTAAINALMQEFLGKNNSVLRFYELVGTQWPTHPLAPAIPGGQGSAPESIVRKMPGEVSPVYLINSTMETYFQKGYQPAGPSEQDDRVMFDIDTTPIFVTESCTGCHYSAGACLGFRKNLLGQFLRDPDTGEKVPMWGQNSNNGLNGSANYSWLLQIEAKSKEKPVKNN